MELNKVFNCDCIDFMSKMKNDSIDLLLIDIPYGEVNRNSNGLRNLDKGQADILTFNLDAFLSECYRITKNTIIIFCGKGQFSAIYNYFSQYQQKKRGTVRQLIWNKTNPSPMNGQYIYLSSTENAVWFRKPKATFNAHCKGEVFTYPTGRSKLHPTEKNFNLIKELILDNSNEGQLVFDPCCGSGTHLLAAKALNRNYLGCEINKEWFDISNSRLKELI